MFGPQIRAIIISNLSGDLAFWPNKMGAKARSTDKEREKSKVTK